MIQETKYFLSNNSPLSLFLLKKSNKLEFSFINSKLNNLINPDIKQKNNCNSKIDFLDIIKTNNNNIKKKEFERLLKEINFVPKLNKDNLLHNICLKNNIFFVEGLKAWEKYGVSKNNYSCILFDEIIKININDNFFIDEEKSSNILYNILKTKIKKIGKNGNNIGSAFLCGLFFNRELDAMISVSVGNILYSILRETSRQKYEIIYTSTEKYHDINTPYQLSPFNQDYNYLEIKYHHININDIILITNNKQNIIQFLDKINSKEEILSIDNFRINDNDYLAQFKIIKEKIKIVNNDNLSISSTSNSS